MVFRRRTVSGEARTRRDTTCCRVPGGLVGGSGVPIGCKIPLGCRKLGRRVFVNDGVSLEFERIGRREFLGVV